MINTEKIEVEQALVARKVKWAMWLVAMMGTALLIYMLAHASVALRYLYDGLGNLFPEPSLGLKMVATFHLVEVLGLHLLATYAIVTARKNLNAGVLRIEDPAAVGENYLWLAVCLTFVVFGLESLLYLRWLTHGRAPTDVNLLVTIGVAFFISLCAQLLALMVAFGRRSSYYKHSLQALHAYAGVPAIFPLILGMSAMNALLFLGTFLCSLALQSVGDRLWVDVCRSHQNRSET